MRGVILFAIVSQGGQIMSATARQRIYLYPLPLLMLTSSPAAQQAALPEVVELPPVVVTTPSPVVKTAKPKTPKKPKPAPVQASTGSGAAKKKAKTGQSAPQPTPPVAAAPPPELEAEPLEADLPWLGGIAMQDCVLSVAC